MARRAVDQELTKEKILDVARDLFVTQGYRSVSMRQIAAALGYSHGSIYYHFKSKADLFYSLVNQDFTLLDQKLEEVLLADEEPRQKLFHVLLGFIRFGLEHQSHYEIMFMMKDEELQRYLPSNPDQTYEKFAQAIFSLSEKKANPTMIWSIFLSLHGFVSHYCKSGQSYEEVETLAQAHVQNLCKIIP
ncbi:MAG TPA: TetR/AcrR family transcriptional regulator [Candidatus Bathyarchaeia archaeon]|nr:TetR/AcrR family transcriptional regulator [Candidatus Bathyarchaeia archaeon]